MIEAAKEGDIDKVKQFISGGTVAVNSTDEDGYTAIYMASAYNNSHVVDYLIQRNADVNVPDKV